ncbi:MAG: hypothetical protein P8N02_04055 [Actinomycetota bacterium]|jgi:photosystem II stability/assembly factor-like uncharacterized protein|nr:hypothetical protein [Actinomycetota bacterium]
MLLAGTTDGVFTLHDDGSTQQVLEAINVRDLTIAGKHLFAGTGSGLFTSDDGGRTWAGPQLADHEVWTVRSAPDGTLYAGTQPAGLWRSTDGGLSWQENEALAALPEASQWCVPLDPPLPGRARALVIDQQDPDRIWVGVEVGGVARTVDGGETWTVDLPGENPDLHMMFAHPEQDGTLFISTGYGRFDHIAEEIEGNAGVFRSDDHGQTWEYAWKGITPRYSRPMCIDERDPFSLTVASAPTAFSDHTDADGALAVLLRSDDHGRSWRSLGDDAHSPSAANFHGLIVDPNEAGGVIVGTDTGEVWRVSADAQWTQLGEGLPKVWSLAGQG